MDRRVGEILQPAGVIEIEVGEDDVADVLRRITESLHLPQRGFAHVEADVEHEPEQPAEPRMGVTDVFGAVAGVDEHQPVVRFDQLGGAWNQPEDALAEAIEKWAAERAVGAAPEVMDTHVPPTTRRRGCS